MNLRLLPLAFASLALVHCTTPSGNAFHWDENGTHSLDDDAVELSDADCDDDRCDDADVTRSAGRASTTVTIEQKPSRTAGGN